MNFTLGTAVLLISISCTTLSPQTISLLEASSGLNRTHMNTVPFIPQPKGDCGPTALTMAMQKIEHPITVEQVRPLVLTPDKNGSLPTNMTGAVRTLGLLGVSVSDMTALVSELSVGHPVVVMQNLGFSWWPSWHYVVVVGYDLDQQMIYSHSGSKKSMSMPMTYFERHWRLANHWGLAVLKPGELSASGDELAHLKAASGLEAASRMQEAKLAYVSLLTKWPKSLAAYVGLGNVAYHQKDFKASETYLLQGLKHHPESKVLQNNLEVVRTRK